MMYHAELTIIDSEKNTESRPAHLKYISDLYEAGKVFRAGPFLDKKGGLVIYDCETEEEALRLANDDPAVTSGARTVKVRAWQPLDFPISGQ